VVQNKPLDLSHLVKGFARDHLDAVIRKVNDLELVMLVPDAKDVPVEDGDRVAVEDEHLDAVWELLQHVSVLKREKSRCLCCASCYSRGNRIR
jgi:hypothetical protein